MTLLVAPIRVTDLSPDHLSQIFGVPAFVSTSRRLPDDALTLLASLPVTHVVTLGVELTGRFHADVPVDHIDPGDAAGWLWVLSGDGTFVGLQAENDLAAARSEVPILLPASAGAAPGDGAIVASGRVGRDGVPMDPTEDELLSDPQLFSDDPGTFCRPFSNPSRIVSEHSFQTILRVEQPTIGGRQSVPPDHRIPPYSPLFPGFNAVLTAIALDPGDDDAADDVRRTTPSRPAGPGPGPDGVRVSAKAATVAVADERRDWTTSKSRGRYVLNGNEPLDWEGDSYPYQASSLGFGHLLDFRVRTRSNGYSLGKVAHSLTLAPRQTKRIVTISSEVRDRISRSEATEAADEVDHLTARDYSYSDQVSATLREWARGGSDSTVSGAAGGIGFAIPGVVMGGGAAHGESHSASWSRGGRDVAAHEQQSLTDAVRGHGSSLRALESLVVVEQSQEETTTGVSEVVRNANYGHSLTVIYHEILRHLRVDTELVGARECVFVPFALGAFTHERTWRWRDIIQSGLRKPRLRWVMRHLRELSATGRYVGTEIPAGPRAVHPVSYVSGSLQVRLGIERPKEDEAAEEFNEPAWLLLAPFMGLSIQAVRTMLRRSKDQRDEVFQREVAPGIAARWINMLEILDSNGDPLTGALDFTLASTYRFGSTVRVNFTYRPDNPAQLSRSRLVDLTLKPTEPLTAGSVASLERISYHYFTDHFDRQVSSDRSSDDLLLPGTGAPESALVHTPLTTYEQHDLRKEIEGAAAELLSHLNEHAEYYHKLIWWRMDRDKLYMMLDSLYLSETDKRSVASVVEREPLAIVGNSLVYAAAGGAHIKVDGHQTPADLHNHYMDPTARPEPVRISLSTSGLYAQAILDDCEALEEHLGSTDWVLSDEEPELAELVPELLASRRAAGPDVAPTPFGTPIISLQNAASPPAPQGFTDVLGALQNPNAFRDTAGLAATQANALGAFTGAAELASGFAAKALDLKKAELAAKTANDKLNVIKKAKKEGLTDGATAKKEADRALDEMNEVDSTSVSTKDVTTMAETADDRQVEVEVNKPAGTAKVTPRRPTRRQPKPGKVTKDFRFTFFGLNSRLLEATWGVRIGASGQAQWDDVSSDRSELRLDGVEFDPSEGLFVSVFSNGSTQSSTVLSATSVFYFVAHRRFAVPDGPKVFVNVTIKSLEVEHESTVQLTREEVLGTVFGEKLSVKAEVLGGIVGGGIETGMEFQENRTASSGSSTGEVWKYKATVPLGALDLDLQEL
jgi:hypothetical protein